uniref:Uncharacterized protein n=1 Tax=uncultured prokaryote TaxID=198431 RepID=A0A0H5QM73_9ZZZZ|nr:hypothetical protein [uncultured prokaryote]
MAVETRHLRRRRQITEGILTNSSWLVTISCSRLCWRATDQDTLGVRYPKRTESFALVAPLGFFVLESGHLTCAQSRAPTFMSFLPVGSSQERAVRVYPNGECVIWRQKVKRASSFVKRDDTDRSLFLWACWVLYLENREALCSASFFMGLSLVRNFDNLANPSVCLPPANDCDREEDALWFFSPGSDDVAPAPKSSTRHGLKGIPRSAARIVRNAAYLLQKKVGRENLTFATVTVPAMPLEKMRVLHENWHKVVELYRLGLRRALQKKGLSGETVGVSEIQEERRERTGLPVLHLHTVFQGRWPYGQWAVTTKTHDRLWGNAVRAVIPYALVSFKSAANLQEVRTSAANYLGKYITKGVASVQKIVDEGMSDWLPRQWWNVTRSLRAAVDAETVRADGLAEQMLIAAQRDNKVVWLFHGSVSIDIGGMTDYWVATYGRLTPEWLSVTRAYSLGKKLGRYKKT